MGDVVNMACPFTFVSVRLARWKTLGGSHHSNKKMQALTQAASGAPVTLETHCQCPKCFPGTAVVRILTANVSPNSRKIQSGVIKLPHLPCPCTLSTAAVRRIHAMGPDATTL